MRMLTAVLLLCGTVLCSGVEEERQLVAAVHSLDGAKVAALVAGGVDVNARDAHGTPVIIGLMTGFNSFDAAGAEDLKRRAILVTLLKAPGLDLNARNAAGETLLIEVIRSFGGRPYLELLLDRGADPSAPGRTWTPLYETAIRDLPDEAAVLLRHGARVDDGERPEVGGKPTAQRTPLMAAVRKGAAAVAELLRSHGASLARKDRSGISVAGLLRTAPHWLDHEPALTEKEIMILEGLRPFLTATGDLPEPKDLDAAYAATLTRLEQHLAVQLAQARRDPTFNQRQLTVLELYKTFLIQHEKQFRNAHGAGHGRALHPDNDVLELFAQARGRIKEIAIEREPGDLRETFQRTGAIQLRPLSHDVLLVGSGNRIPSRNLDKADTVNPLLAENPTVVGFFGETGTDSLFKDNQYRLISDEVPLGLGRPDGAPAATAWRLLNPDGVLVTMAHDICRPWTYLGEKVLPMDRTRYLVHVHILSSAPSPSLAQVLDEWENKDGYADIRSTFRAEEAAQANPELARIFALMREAWVQNTGIPLRRPVNLLFKNPGVLKALGDFVCPYAPAVNPDPPLLVEQPD